MEDIEKEWLFAALLQYIIPFACMIVGVVIESIIHNIVFSISIIVLVGALYNLFSAVYYLKIVQWNK